MRRKVVIGFNEFPQGEDALGLGHRLAGALDASALVTIVVQHPRHGADDEKLDAAVSEFCDPLFAKARERLDGLQVEDRPIVSRSRSRAFFELAGELDRLALIVIGSTHRGAVGRVLLGTLGDSLLSGAPCAVAVAPLGYAAREGGLERIGVAVDGSSEAWRALNAGVELATSLELPLNLLSVVDPPAYVLGGLLSDFNPGEYREFERRETARLLEEATERVPEAIHVERQVLEGDPAEALAEAGEELDLLILGSRAYGPITHTLLGGVSGKLMASAPCPLLVTPRGSGLHPLGR